MKLQEIREMASGKGIRPAKHNKAALIRLIQRQEGNFDCFGSADAGECDQAACLWREDCLTSTRQRTS